ncbi:mannosyl-3-phosphoglycerate synthase [Amorphoplanes nipponensis]
MRLADSFRSERFGAVRIHELQRVIELDSGALDDAFSAGSRVVPPEAIRAVESQMVIVVPCMNESRSVIEGVLSGIPHDCLIVLVSNSDQLPVNRYEIEAQTLEQFCRLAGRSAISVHQQDPGLAAAIKAAGMAELIGEDGLVRAGKGEAMLIGMALAAMTGRRHVGYVDADNYVPGAVHEYCKAYAAGLHLAESPYSMVRISWHSKPKLRDGRLFFSRRGRSSEITNEWLNRFLAEYSGFGTEVIATGNAGEHAMTLELGLKLRLAGGFAVEPYEYLDLFEQFGGILESASPDVMASSGAGAADRDPQPALPRQQGRGTRPGDADAGAERGLPLAGDTARRAAGDRRVHGGAGRAGGGAGAAARAGLPAGGAAWTWSCSTTGWTPRR